MVHECCTQMPRPNAVTHHAGEGLLRWRTKTHCSNQEGHPRVRCVSINCGWVVPPPESQTSLVLALLVLSPGPTRFLNFRPISKCCFNVFKSSEAKKDPSQSATDFEAGDFSEVKRSAQTLASTEDSG